MKALAIRFGIIYLIPIVLALIYRLFPLGSSGPVVLGYPLLSMFFVSWFLGSFFIRRGWNDILAHGLSFLLAMLNTAVLINYFIAITYLFGIMDYHLM